MPKVKGTLGETRARPPGRHGRKGVLNAHHNEPLADACLRSDRRHRHGREGGGCTDQVGVGTPEGAAAPRPGTSSGRSRRSDRAQDDRGPVPLGRIVAGRLRLLGARLFAYGRLDVKPAAQLVRALPARPQRRPLGDEARRPGLLLRRRPRRRSTSATAASSQATHSGDHVRISSLNEPGYAAAFDGGPDRGSARSATEAGALAAPEERRRAADVGDERDERAQLQRSCHSTPCSTRTGSAPAAPFLERSGATSYTAGVPASTEVTAEQRRSSGKRRSSTRRSPSSSRRSRTPRSATRSPSA